MRLLLFGGWGQLGTELAALAQTHHEVIRPRRGDADVTDPPTVERVVAQSAADAVVNLAAFHKVERCEEDPGTALSVNAVGAWTVARAARSAGARCVFVSSDYVFDGDEPKGYAEDDAVRPVNAYGVSKAAGERLVSLACPDSLVVRASGLFGHAGSSGKGGNFVETILAKAAAGEPLAVVDDQVTAPTPAHDVAQRLLLFLDREAPPGTYHAASTGRCSWFEFARAILDLAGSAAELSPRTSEGDPVRRPRWSVLVDTKSSELGLPPMRPWRDALAWYMSRRPPRPVSVGGER
jgi:dTDP-4-dehydrorhamnose reductase